jgi:hypothetical protein
MSDRSARTFTVTTRLADGQRHQQQVTAASFYASPEGVEFTNGTTSTRSTVAFFATADLVSVVDTEAAPS